MKKYEIVIQDDKGNTLQTIPAKYKTLTNKEAIEIVSGIRDSFQEDCFNEIEALDLAIKSLEEVKGLRLLIDWAVECGFGYDNFPEEYEKYKDKVKDMEYVDGMIYIATQEENKDMRGEEG